MRACVRVYRLEPSQEAPGGVTDCVPRQANKQPPAGDADHGADGWSPRRGAR